MAKRMPKSFCRFIALILAACLVADPAWASIGALLPAHPAPAAVTLFTTEALSVRDCQTPRDPLTNPTTRRQYYVQGQVKAALTNDREGRRDPSSPHEDFTNEKDAIFGALLKRVAGGLFVFKTD